MAEAHKTENGKMKVPEFLREPLVAAQARIGHIEEEAQRVLKDLVVRGRAGRKDIEEIVHRLSRQDFSLPEVKQRLEKLRDQGAERAAGWGDRAESLRSSPGTPRTAVFRGRSRAIAAGLSRMRFMRPKSGPHSLWSATSRRSMPSCLTRRWPPFSMRWLPGTS